MPAESGYGIFRCGAAHLIYESHIDFRRIVWYCVQKVFCFQTEYIGVNVNEKVSRALMNF